MTAKDHSPYMWIIFFLCQWYKIYTKKINKQEDWNDFQFGRELYVKILSLLNSIVDVCLSYFGMRCGRSRHQHHGNHPDSKETGSLCLSRPFSHIKCKWCGSCHLLRSPFLITWYLAILRKIYSSPYWSISTSLHAYCSYDVGIFYNSYKVTK